MRREIALAAERVERKLAVILAADVAGYSRLMGADEEGTLARLKAHRRELIDPKIVEHRGRIVKTIGDGLLVEFASPVEAVRCAAEIQKAMREREGSLPQERRIEVRVRINLGGVIIDEDDVYGDGVNIAARLEALADPGVWSYPARYSNRCGIACPTVSRISGTSRSRTSPARFGFIAWRWSDALRLQRDPHRCRSPTGRRSPCCHSRT